MTTTDTTDNEQPPHYTRRDWAMIGLHLFLALAAPSLGWVGIIVVVRWMLAQV